MCQKLSEVFRSGSRSCRDQLLKNEVARDEIDPRKNSVAQTIKRALERLSEAPREARETEAWCLWESGLDIEPHVAHLPAHGTKGYDPFVRARVLANLSEPHFKKDGKGKLLCAYLRNEGFEVEVRYEQDSTRPFLLMNYWKIIAKW